MGLWIVLLAASGLWTLSGQTGYIHPDEFFQSVEVVAGDTLDLQVKKTWEFNETHPLRSIVLPCLICGLPLKFLRLTGASTYWLLVAPRLAVFLLSLVNAWLLYQIARQMKVKETSVMWCYVTSYITQVFFTRTFSNTFEAFLFTALIYLVTKEDQIEERTKLAQGSGDGASKTVTCEYVRVERVLPLTCVLVCGLFNRPTFVIFAFVPCLSWIFSGKPKSEVCSCSTWICVKYLESVAWRVACLGLSAVFVVIVFILCDSIYYNPEILAKIMNGEMEGIWSELRITPLNFILYNTNSANLSEHGVHPRTTHVLLNCPQLFLFFPLFMYYDMGRHLWRVARGKSKVLNENEIYLMLLIAVPLVGLSVFPHQEPRFLIPLLTPFLLLYANSLFSSSFFWKMFWISGNIVLSIFFGMIHQGGVIPCLRQLATVSSCQKHLIFWQTYMPPTYLLNIPKEPPDFGSSICEIHTSVMDLKGEASFMLYQTLAEKVDQTLRSSGNSNIFLVAPAMMDEELCEGRFEIAPFRIVFEKQFFPHFSGEHKLDFKKEFVTCTDHDSDELEGIAQWKNALSLNLYRIMPRY